MSDNELFGEEEETTDCESESLGTDAQEEEKEIRLIGRVREWYNRKLQDIINASPDIDLDLKEVLQISTVDQYSAKYITNEVFGILHRVDTDHEFYMVKRVQQPDHNEGTANAIPYAPYYILTKFTEYTAHDRNVLGKQRYIISPQVYCQCTYIKHKWFQDPFTTWAVEKSDIAPSGQ